MRPQFPVVLLDFLDSVDLVLKAGIRLVCPLKEVVLSLGFNGRSVCIMRLSKRLLQGALGVLLLGARVTEGGTIALSLTGGIDTSNNIWTLGFEFQALANISVTHLGFYDAGSDGLSESHFVGVWDTVGTLLASATVLPSDSLVNGFRYTAISALALTSGQNYVIGAVTGTEPYSGFNLVTTASDVLYVQDRYDVDLLGTGTPDYPESSSNLPASSAGWFGPNFMFAPTAVPEPSSLALCGLGVATVIARQIRRRRTA